MTRRDDSPTDMDSQDLSDEQVESLLAGSTTPPGFEGVAAEFAGLRDFGSRVDDVAVSAQLAEFVTHPSAPPSGPRLVPVPIAVPAAVSLDQPRRKRMIAGALAAKLAMAGGIAVAGVTGAHAVGLVDVPLLPSQGDPIEFVSATQPAEGEQTPPTPAPLANSDQDPTGPDDAEPNAEPDLDGTINIRVGDAEFSIRIDGSGEGDLSIKVDVEGVSPACEAALESLGDLTDVEAFESAGQDVEQACAEDFADLSPSLGDLDFEADGVFGGVFGQGFGDCDLGDDPTGSSLDELLESCLPEGMEIFGDLGDFEYFRDQFGKDFGDFGDLGDIEGLLEDLDLGDLDLGDLDLGDLDLGDLDLESLLEDLDLGDLDLESLLEGQDFSQFEDLLDDLDLGGLLEGQDLGDLQGLIEDLLPQLDGS